MTEINYLSFGDKVLEALNVKTKEINAEQLYFKL